MSSNTALQVPDLDHIYHYVPGEICILASADGDPYETIRKRLNDEIVPLLPLRNHTAVNPGTTPEDEILGPTAVWKTFSVINSDTSVFQPVDRKIAGVSAPFRQQGAPFALHFYRVELDPSKKLKTMQEYARLVRELVNLIHKHFVDPDTAQVMKDGVTYLGVSPNWLSSVAGSGSNGPGTPSLPVNPNRVANNNDYARFHFWDGAALGNRDLEGLVVAHRTIAAPEIEVAVLDTCPPINQVDHAPATRVLGEVLGGNPVAIEANPSLDATQDFREQIPFLPNSLAGLVPWLNAVDMGVDAQLPPLRDLYGAPDHGLFVAGIIRDIAPGVTVSLHRVLDDAGVGDLLAIAFVLSRLAADAPQKRLIINLSLTFNIPTRAELRAYWTRPGDPAAVMLRLNKILDNALLCLSMLFQHLRAKKILVVAAAGNDGEEATPRPEAHLPARDENVFSVSSMTRDNAPSFFSNNSADAHGVAVLGGDGRPHLAPPRMKLENDANEQPDGVQGIFSGPNMTSNETGDPTTPPKPHNDSGWVFWAGTSFAAPIISAIAAVIQANQKQMGQQLVEIPAWIDLVKGYETGKAATKPPLDCGWIYAVQEQV